MTVVNGDIIRGVAEFYGPSAGVAQNVFHFEYTGAGDTDQEIGNKFQTWLVQAYADILAKISNVVTSEFSRVLRYDTVANEWVGIDDQTWDGSDGEWADHMLPHGAAALVRKYTAVPKRQGRTFIYGLAESSQTHGVWDAATIVELALALAAMMNTQATANGTLTPGIYEASTETFRPFINAGAVNIYASYQRRRRPGVGI